MTTTIQPQYLKAIIGGAVCYAGDKFVLKEPDMMSSVYFAGSSALGLYAGSMLGTQVASMLPPSGIVGLGERASEIGIAIGTSYALNHFILKNDNYNTGMQRALVVAASDILAQYATDFLTGAPMVILN